ncbi:MAG: hypothetical protein KKH28_00730 [Elusimicrobia bacterium]|nr:hypothetical protein [Elusimicrobiota bacterium]
MKLARQLVAVLFLVGLVFAAAQSVRAADYPLRAITVLPNFGGLGLGTRNWETEQLGWDVQFQPSWEFNDFTYSASALWAPIPPDTKKWYFGAGIGGFSYNDDYSWTGTSMEMKYSGLFFKLFAGCEWLKGINKNHGVSVEGGLQFGSAEADFTSGGYSGTVDFTMPIIYLGGTYAFYYNK